MNFIAISAIIIFILYLVFALFVYGAVPQSLSDTYYILNASKKNLGLLFTAMMFVVGFLLVPVLLDLTKNENFQFIAFLCPSFCMLVGAAPKFKSIDSGFHSAFAIGCAITSFLWIFLNNVIEVSFSIVLASAILMLVLGILTQTLKHCKTFWLEMIAFLSMFITMLYDL